MTYPATGRFTEAEMTHTSEATDEITDIGSKTPGRAVPKGDLDGFQDVRPFLL